MSEALSQVASRIRSGSSSHHPPIDLEALRNARVERERFAYFIVPRFVNAAALDGIRADFPAIAHAGSFPLSTLSYGPAFAAFMQAIQSPDMTAAVGEKLGMDLSASPTMVTVRGQSRAADGKIHTDSRTKLVTALIYMNDSWESAKGRLRLLRSPSDLNDVIAEVPPDEGTLLVFENTTNAWHGFEPFSGPRRVIQLNWVTDESVVRREQARHRLSAFFKRLRGRRA
jgi:SM-20-related protein